MRAPGHPLSLEEQLPASCAHLDSCSLSAARASDRGVSAASRPEIHRRSLPYPPPPLPLASSSPTSSPGPSVLPRQESSDIYPARRSSILSSRAWPSLSFYCIYAVWRASVPSLDLPAPRASRDSVQIASLGLSQLPACLSVCDHLIYHCPGCPRPMPSHHGGLRHHDHVLPGQPAVAGQYAGHGVSQCHVRHGTAGPALQL